MFAVNIFVQLRIAYDIELLRTFNAVLLGRQGEESGRLNGNDGENGWNGEKEMGLAEMGYG